MRKPLLLLAALVGIWPLVGCAGGTINTYTDPSIPVTVEAGQEFNIAVELACSDPTTWEQHYDETLLELKETVCATCVSGESACSIAPGYCPLVGPSVVSLARFQALQPGETEVTISYQLVGGGAPLKDQIFTVTIEPAS
jgi:predicted secreted protein